MTGLVAAGLALMFAGGDAQASPDLGLGQVSDADIQRCWGRNSSPSLDIGGHLFFGHWHVGHSRHVHVNSADATGGGGGGATGGGGGSGGSSGSMQIPDDPRVDRMAAVDRNVLRLATYELLHTETPASIILDEAIELARDFGGERSPAFVNGVLDALARERTTRADAKSEGPEG